MSTDFGDYDNDDAYDTEPPDPEQVARKLQRLRHEREIGTRHWGDLDEAERELAVTIMRRLLDWLRRQGGIR